MSGDHRLRTGGFNGATAMKPWKSAGELDSPEIRLQLQWGHGDEAVEESRAVVVVLDSSASLQWGHGDEAVEEDSVMADATRAAEASMGPRR